MCSISQHLASLLHWNADSETAHHTEYCSVSTNMSSWCPVVLQTYTVQDRQRFRVIFLFCFLGLKTMNETFKTEGDTGVKCHTLQSLWSSHRLQQCKAFRFDFLKAFMILLEWFFVYLLPHCSSERLKEICLTCTFNLGSPVYQTSVCLDCGGKLEYLEDCR